uniref:hypothetical protein n=1 Tax=Breoghania sp. TaxID=2065378 RepID=UPI00262FBC0A
MNPQTYSSNFSPFLFQKADFSEAPTVSETFTPLPEFEAEAGRNSTTGTVGFGFTETSTTLFKPQWDNIQNPSGRFNLDNVLQDVEEGELVTSKPTKAGTYEGQKE